MRSRASVRRGWARCATSWRRERVLANRAPQLLAGSLCRGSGGGERRARVGRRRAACRCGCRFACLRRAGSRRVVVLALALALAGWGWGSARLDTLDRSVARLEARHVRARAVVWSPRPSRTGRYDVRAPAVVTRFGALRLHEPVLLELPLGRAPPQGGIIETIAEVTAPHGPKNGFDERTWLRRHGVHVVLRAGSWRLVGRRGGLGGVADAVRGRLRARSPAGSPAIAPESSRASSWVKTQAFPTSCGGAFARPGSTTCSRCPGRTSQWSPGARSCSRGSRALRGFSASSRRSPRSALTSSPSARSRR